MSTTRMATPELPSVEALELADYKISTYLSDLDEICSELEHAREPITAEEYLRLTAEGKELPPAPHYDAAQLARIIVFATDALNDVHMIVEAAEKIQHTALTLYHEAPGHGFVGPAHDRRIRRWHEAEANALRARIGGDDA